MNEPVDGWVNESIMSPSVFFLTFTTSSCSTAPELQTHSVWLMELPHSSRCRTAGSCKVVVRRSPHSEAAQSATAQHKADRRKQQHDGCEALNALTSKGCSLRVRLPVETRFLYFYSSIYWRGKSHSGNNYRSCGLAGQWTSPFPHGAAAHTELSPLRSFSWKRVR